MEENNKFDNKSLKKVTGRTADFDELSKDCVAFANSHGGYLAIGIEDGEEKPAPDQKIPDDLPEKIIKRIVAGAQLQFPTTLKTIEPYRLRALIHEDLRYHPNSTMAEISNRLPDVVFAELAKMVSKMVKNDEIIPIGGKKYRKYSLSDSSFSSTNGRK